MVANCLIYKDVLKIQFLIFLYENSGGQAFKVTFSLLVKLFQRDLNGICLQNRKSDFRLWDLQYLASAKLVILPCTQSSDMIWVAQIKIQKIPDICIISYSLTLHV